ncbi:ribose-phosphate diphosphokinase [Paenibacillus allorhizosphaerae]|uniref:ribose-phosphate diphosphokinase n=1 Tax=Paenibacillus allorhizosphaerae TaxID=2849866 RepID=A0ABM8VGE8_9BACL|nr:ribose-phosphate diphosphokinase [Paenibacillus allorhizosphaerae]CAG7638324.1 Ribose-phosphate pyrophosphokinase [Paenibacillus allorhizosphaerae]
MSIGEIKIFAGSSGKAFADKMCRYMGADVGRSESFTFSDGNTFVRIGETVRDKDVYLVQSIGLKPNDEFVEILFWIDAFKRASANTVTVIMPYFGYAKGDKKDEPRVSIRARVCAESIELAGADRVVAMDLHSHQIQGFFKKPVDHLFALPVLCETLMRMQLPEPVIVSPDAGFAKQARKYADYIGAPLAIGDKTRKDHSERAEIMELIGDVRGKTAVIIDDFSISGGTLVELAGLLVKRGAARVLACLSHLVLSKEAVKKIEDSPIELIIGTDSIDNPHIAECSKVMVVSIAPLFGEAISRIHRRESVSPLFEKVPDKLITCSFD